MIHFDNSPKVYFILCYGIGWFILALAIWSKKLSSQSGWLRFINTDTFFLASALLTLFLLRLPSIVYNQEIDVDESQMITQALTLLQDPVYFRSVDGTTNGPLDNYILVVPHFLGLPFDYVTARLVAYVLTALSLGLLFYATRSVFGQQPARLSLVPFILVLGPSQTQNFLIYGSELLSVTTLSWLYFLFIRHPSGVVRSSTQLFLIGFLCGIVPYEKLQGALLAALVGMFVLGELLINKNLSVSKRIQKLLALASGALCFSVLFITWIYWEGYFDDFITFYIKDNLTYGQPLPLWQRLIRFQSFLPKSPEFTWLMALLAGITVVWLITLLRRRIVLAQVPAIPVFLVLLNVVAIYTVTLPGYYFVHYLFYLFGPLMLLLAFVLSTMHSPFSRLSVAWLSAVFIAAFTVRIITTSLLNPFPTDNQGGWKLSQNIVTNEIARYAHAGESLAVWGWHCDYYVSLQMPQATAEAHTSRSIEHKTMRDVYHNRYARDMKRTLPPVFVDVVGKQGYYLTNRKTQGYEINAPLKQLIARFYTYIGPTDDVRIFVRNDRYASLKP